MTIAVDACKLSQQLDGVGNFLFNALRALVKNRSYNFILFSNKEIPNRIKEKICLYDNVKIIVCSPVILSLNSFVWFLIVLPFLIKKSKVDYFFAPAVLYPLFIPKSVKIISTIHDLVYLEYPQTMSLRNKAGNKLLFNRSIKKANILWAVSNYTKQRLLYHFRDIDPQKIFVGSSIASSKFSEKVLSENEKIGFLKVHSIPSPFLLFVGTIEPRKNLKFLLELFPLLPTNLNLVVVGANGWGEETELSRILNSENYPRQRVFFLGYISDEDLELFYKTASAFISCSINEGFGLPQLEAIYCNCPVICAKNSAMIEVVEGCGMLVDGWEKAKWIDAINFILDMKPDYTKNRKQKMAYYDWNKIANKFYLFLNNF